MIDIDVWLESDALYRTDLGAVIFDWRLLTLKEFRLFSAMKQGGVLSPMVLHNKVFERCFLGNVHALSDDLPAGLTISIGELIMWLSGEREATDLRDEIEESREAYPAGAVIEHMKRVILTAMPTYTLEVIECWPRTKLMDRFAFAEELLKYRSNGEFTPMDVRKIKLAGEEDQQPNHGIDFAKENAQLEQKLGWQEKEQRSVPTAVKRPREKRVPVQDSKPNGLTPQQAAALERRARAQAAMRRGR